MKNYIVALLALILTGFTFPNARRRQEEKLSDLTASAKTFIELLAQGNYSSAVDYFDNAMRTALPEDKLRTTWDAVIAHAGPLRKQLSVRAQKVRIYDIVFVTCEFERLTLDVKLVFDEAKQITGLFFVPVQTSTVYTLPNYVKQNRFREKEVTVGTGEWVAHGTLTLPESRRPFPAIVLVHGSGPHDRNETIGGKQTISRFGLGIGLKRSCCSSIREANERARGKACLREN